MVRAIVSSMSLDSNLRAGLFAPFFSCIYNILPRFSKRFDSAFFLLE